jgi:hypothetical protein
MGILDRIMGVSKKKESIPDLDFGKGFGPEPGDDEIGGMGDTTPGLGGTGNLGSMAPHELPPTPSRPDEVIHGYGHEDVKMERAELRPEHQPFSRPTITEARYESSGVSSKDIEILSSKLDAVKAQLEMINNRLSTIEMRIDDVKRRGGW